MVWSGGSGFVMRRHDEVVDCLEGLLHDSMEDVSSCWLSIRVALFRNGFVVFDIH